ncbi:hypothetical protein [Corallococcus sp. CA053C]|uniref:hypothetical protein n=1 Tax=Corallococcus sp. CA053C TaxID=2316732 RepID=UPI001F18AE0C|nr:hypothetical protein [Corallococcus sp. CA053C]
MAERVAHDASEIWEEWGTGWASLDCELMPRLLKANEVLRDQYATMGAASLATPSDVLAMLGQVPTRTNRALFLR